MKNVRHNLHKFFHWRKHQRDDKSDSQKEALVTYVFPARILVTLQLLTITTIVKKSAWLSSRPYIVPSGDQVKFLPRSYTFLAILWGLI